MRKVGLAMTVAMVPVSPLRAPNEIEIADLPHGRGDEDFASDGEGGNAADAGPRDEGRGLVHYRPTPARVTGSSGGVSGAAGLQIGTRGAVGDEADSGGEEQNADPA